MEKRHKKIIQKRGHTVYEKHRFYWQAKKYILQKMKNNFYHLRLQGYGKYKNTLCKKFTLTRTFLHNASGTINLYNHFGIQLGNIYHES